METMPTNYEEASPPMNYKCSKCGKHGVKLWRQYQTFADHIELLCGACALEDQKKTGPIDEEGRILDETVLNIKCDQIGWLVPAVPTKEGDTFWGYTSVPQPGVDWWKKLPTELKEVK